MGSPLRALYRSILYVFWTLALMPVQAVAVALRLPAAATLPLVYHRQCSRILGLDIEVRGEKSTARPTLFVANHSTYLDITVLAAVITGSFVAKAEVARWPFFGWLAKLQRTVFVDRRAANAATQRDEIARRLEAGDDLILFPEGTSSDGTGVLPFKSALFAVAQREIGGRALTVQPVSLVYTRLNGAALTDDLRPLVAWYGDMEMLPHFWGLLGLGSLNAVVEFHPPVTIRDYPSRKALAARCHDAVSHGVVAASV